MFSTLNIKRCYRTKKDDIKNELLIPLISNASKYDRGTGFFSLDALVDLTSGIIPYLKKGGNIRIITSVDLDLNELDVIKKGIEFGRNKVVEQINKEIEQELNEQKQLISMDLIANLIAVDRLQIKIAYLPGGGIYHEKIGYIEDDEGESIWFSGSNNVTYNGLNKNAESFLVLKSWQGDSQDIIEQCKYFDSLWNDREDEINVFDIPDACKNKLFSKFKRSDNIFDAIKKFEESLSFPSKKELYPYQSKAIDEFVVNGYCHFYEMATGTGKTFTAVKTVERMKKDMGNKSLYVLVVVPQIDLQIQWEKEFSEIGINCHLFGGVSTNKDWELELSNSLIKYYNGEKIVASICVYDTFFSKVNSVIDSKRINKLLIIDEAHELSNNQIHQLSPNFRFRLGLSATPERHSAVETKQIIDYFTKGKIETFKYTIEEAIENNFLSKYKYFPIEVRLENDDLEFKKYQKYTLQLAQLLNEEIIDQEKVQDVLNNRCIIVKKARNKTLKLSEMIQSKLYDFKNSVIYCGQGKDLITEESIIDGVSRILKSQGKYRSSQFTSKTLNRTEVLKEFESGYYETLVAIKCFDQGVDVPKLDKIYIMASDTLLRQTIQRRGRVLRKCKETGKQIAYIYDFICLPPEGIYEGVGVGSLVAKELKRAKEYGRLATNKHEVDNFINELVCEYNVTEDSDDEREANN